MAFLKFIFFCLLRTQRYKKIYEEQKKISALSPSTNEANSLLLADDLYNTYYHFCKIKLFVNFALDLK